MALGGPNVFPGSRTWAGLARELTAGTPLLPGVTPAIAGMSSTIPLDKSSFEPEDTPHWLHDNSLRGNMGHTYAVILGPEDASFNYGGPFYGDMDGFFLDNVFGDLSTVYNGSFAGTTSLAQAVAVGGTTATVASGASFTAGGFAQFGTGVTAEVVPLTAVAGSVLSFANCPLRYAQGSASSVFAVGTAATSTSNFTHAFNLLNSAQGYGGAYGAQPPTHTVTDYLGPMTGASGGTTNTFGARLYPSTCVAQLDLTGNSEQLLQAKVTGTSWISTPAGSAPTNVVSAVVPIANWRSTVQVGAINSPSTLGSVNTIGEWTVSFKRELQVYWNDDGSQNPFIIARGNLDVTGANHYATPGDESPLDLMEQNVQPAMLISINNGQAGTASSYLGLSIAFAQAAYLKAKPTRSSVLVGYETEWTAVDNVTNVGGSGGQGPCTVSLTNNCPTY